LVVHSYFNKEEIGADPRWVVRHCDVAQRIDADGFMVIRDRSKVIIKKSGGEWSLRVELENIAIVSPGENRKMPPPSPPITLNGTKRPDP